MYFICVCFVLGVCIVVLKIARCLIVVVQLWLGISIMFQVQLHGAGSLLLCF